MVEFTLVGIPVVFALISIFELSLGMWQYHTLAHAIREGTRFAIVHGKGCDSANCRVTVGDIAQHIRTVGLVQNDLNLEFESEHGGTVSCRLDACLAKTSRPGDIWPPAGSDSPGMEVTIRGVYSVHTILMMFNMAGSTGGAFTFRLPAASTDIIQF